MSETRVPGGLKGAWYRLSGKTAQIERQQQEVQRKAAFEQRSSSAVQSIQEAVALDEELLSKVAREIKTSRLDEEVAEQFFQQAASGLDQLQDSKQPGIQRVKGPTYFVRLDKFDPEIFNPYKGRGFDSEHGLPSGNVAIDAQKIFAEEFKNPPSGKFEHLL